jgi:hypothetical protein
MVSLLLRLQGYPQPDAPFAQRQIIEKTPRRYDAASAGSHRGPLIALCNIPNATAGTMVQPN